MAPLSGLVQEASLGPPTGHRCHRGGFVPTLTLRIPYRRPPPVSKPFSSTSWILLSPSSCMSLPETAAALTSLPCPLEGFSQQVPCGTGHTKGTDAQPTFLFPETTLHPCRSTQPSQLKCCPTSPPGRAPGLHALCPSGIRPLGASGASSGRWHRKANPALL